MVEGDAETGAVATGMAKGDAETGAFPRVGTASAGGVGVGNDRVTLGILSRNRDRGCSRGFRREEQK